MNAKTFTDMISREVDTDGTKINRAETGRVVRVTLLKLASLDHADLVELLAKAVLAEREG